MIFVLIFPQVSPDKSRPCRPCSCDLRGSLHSACVPDESRATTGTTPHMKGQQPGVHLLFLVIWSQVFSTKYRCNAVFSCLWQVWLWARASVSRATQVRSATGVRSDTQDSLSVSGATAAVRAALTRIPASRPVCVRYERFHITTGLALVIHSRSHSATVIPHYSNTTTLLYESFYIMGMY